MSDWNPVTYAILSWCGLAFIVVAVVLPLRRRWLGKRTKGAPLPQRRRPRPVAPPLSTDGEPLTAGEIRALRAIEDRLEDDLRKERRAARRLP